MASYAALAQAWKTSQQLIGCGALLGIVGIGLFAWSANPPDDVKASAASPAVVTAPSAQKLTLTPAGIDALGSALGKGCRTDRQIPVLVLGKTDAGPDLLVQPGSGCTGIRVLLTMSWGIVDAR